MKLSLGILAHNEAETIGAMISSLSEQSVFRGAVPELTAIELFCVVNGCTDNTAEVAREAFERHLPTPPPGTSLTSNVPVLTLGDKCNAWNVFIHELSARDSSYLGLMDADIRFLAPETIANMVRLLMEDAQIQVATDRPIKTISEGRGHPWIRKFSLASSGLGDQGPHAICGQMYIGRAQVLREIWLPPGLPVEDGFVRACVVTNCFRSTQDLSRVGRAQAASHSFEGETQLSSIIHHQKRLIIGNYINTLLYGFLWKASSGEDNPVNRLRSECENNPAWVKNLIRENIKASRFFFIPKSFIWNRWKRLKGRSLLGKLSVLPVVFGGWIFDVYVARVSEITLRRGQGVGFW